VQKSYPPLYLFVCFAQSRRYVLSDILTRRFFSSGFAEVGADEVTCFDNAGFITGPLE
jgi:hypothetical protein